MQKKIFLKILIKFFIGSSSLLSAYIFASGPVAIDAKKIFELPKEKDDDDFSFNIDEEFSLHSLPQAPIVIGEPSEKEFEELMDQPYQLERPKEELKRIIVGIPNQKSLMTLAQARKEGLVSTLASTAILKQAMRLNDGEIMRLHVKFGMRSPEDIVVGRYPGYLIPNPYDNQNFPAGQVSLTAFTSWLELLGNLTWITPGTAGSSNSLNTLNATTHTFLLNQLALSVATNHYNTSSNQAFNDSMALNSRYLTLASGWASPQSMGSLWFSVMSGWGAVGYTGKYNLEENQFGLSALGAGAWIGGWKNYAQIGGSLSIITGNGDQFGLGIVLSISKDRVTTYKQQYDGQYNELIDKICDEIQKRIKFLASEFFVKKNLIFLMKESGKPITEKMITELDLIGKNGKILQQKQKKLLEEKNKLKGKHFVEVIDIESKGIRGQGAMYVTGIGAGARVGYTVGNQKVHRFYTDLPRAQELMRDGSKSHYGVFRIGTDFDEKEFPNLYEPWNWDTGVEVITTKSKLFNGGIVLGVTPIALFDAKVGLSGTFKATMEVGMRKLPGNKLEVTFKPSHIQEIGTFFTTLLDIGPQLVASSTISLAMRQTYIFDLDMWEAREQYKLFLNNGNLPCKFTFDASIIGEDEEENILDIVRIHKERLEKKGILLTYLEKINVDVKKLYVGLLKLPIIDRGTWAGFSYEWLRGDSKIISTNSFITESKKTVFFTESGAKGRSGDHEKGAYATLKKRYRKTTEPFDLDEINPIAKRDEPVGRKKEGIQSEFMDLILRATISDTIITAHEQNEMVDILNSKFHANIKRYRKEYKPKNQSREIFVERKIGEKELDLITNASPTTIELAAVASGISRDKLATLRDQLWEKGYKAKAKAIRDFVNQHHFNGVAAIHLLADGNSRNLYIRTDSNLYKDSIEKSTQIESLYSLATPSDNPTQVIDLNLDTDKKLVRKIFEEIKTTLDKIDQGLIELADDPFFEEEDIFKDPIEEIIEPPIKKESPPRESKTTIFTKLIAAKNKLIDFIDLKSQGFDFPLRLILYQMVDIKYLDYPEQLLLLKQKYRGNITFKMSRDEIRARWDEISSFLEKIKKEYNSYVDHIEPEKNIPSYNIKKIKIFGNHYIEKRVEILAQLEKEANFILQIDILKEQTAEFVEKMRKRRILGLQAPSDMDLEIANIALKNARE